MIKNNYSQFIRTTADIHHAYEAGELYLKKFEDGKLKSKSGVKRWVAHLGHFFHWITGHAKSDAYDRYQILFAKNLNVNLLTASPLARRQIRRDVTIRDLEITRHVLTESMFFDQDLNKMGQIYQKLNAINRGINERIAAMKEQSLPTADLLNADPNWQKIDSEALLNLQRKLLQKDSSPITDSEKDLLFHCLQVKSKVHEVVKYWNDDLSSYIDYKKLNRVKRTADMISSRALKLHNEFKERYGEVKIVNREPMPTFEQLKGAFHMAFERLPMLMEVRRTPEVRKIAARIIQLLMVGMDYQKVEFPDNDVCFTFKEIYKSQDAITISLKRNEREYDNYFEWFMKRMLPENTAKEQLITDIKQFFIDTIRRSIGKIIVDGKEFVSSKGQTTQLFTYLRQRFFEYLAENPDHIYEVIASNIRHELPTGIKHNLSHAEFSDLIIEAAERAKCREGISKILPLTSFKPQQLAQLAKISNLSEENIEPLLRIQLLRLMSLLTQRTLEMTTEDIGFDLEREPYYRLANKLQAPPDNQLLDENRKWVLSKDLNSFTFEGVASHSLYKSSLSNDYGVREEFLEEKNPICMYQKGIRINKIVPQEWNDKPHAVRMAYTNVRVSPDAVILLDKIKATFS